jgi:diguanylate cyclase
MEDASDDGSRLPVPVTAYGPLHLLAKRVHMLASTGKSPEALTAADAYLEIARTVGDERSVRFLVQGKMYAYLDMGRIPEAIDLGERLLAAHRTGGNVVEEAKTLCDLARMHVLRGRYVDGMLHLARAAVLLERRPARGDRHRSAMCSFAETATVAEMYETAAAAYERLCAFDEPGRASSFDLVYATTLLYWGLRLAHVGRGSESAVRLRRSAAITRRWLDRNGTDPCVLAAHGLALAKLGDVVVAEKLVRDVIVPLRRGESRQHARMAHLALGLSRRAQGDLLEARRELVAARDLCAYGAHPAEGQIIRYEMAVTALELDGGPSSRDLFDAIEGQVRELWLLRQQRLSMLRQARQREEAETARARAEREILRDPLTGLGNRRRFDELLSDVDAGRLRPPLTLLLVDLDHFKAVNDAYSHSAGDRALREVAAILRAECQATDEAVRYAGDEFVLVLRGGPAHGREVAERIRTAVARADVLAGVRLTVSVGLAALSDGMSGDTLFRLADERLYAAKWSGRNAVAA